MTTNRSEGFRWALLLAVLCGCFLWFNRRSCEKSSNNIAIGSYAGYDITTGSYLLCLGDNSCKNITTESYLVCVGESGCVPISPINARMLNGLLNRKLREAINKGASNG